MLGRTTPQKLAVEVGKSRTYKVSPVRKPLGCRTCRRIYIIDEVFSFFFCFRSPHTYIHTSVLWRWVVFEQVGIILRLFLKSLEQGRREQIEIWEQRVKYYSVIAYICM